MYTVFVKDNLYHIMYVSFVLFHCFFFLFFLLSFCFSYHDLSFGTLSLIIHLLVHYICIWSYVSRKSVIKHLVSCILIII